MPDPWGAAQPRQPAYGYGNDNSMSGWQQQTALLQQGPIADQHAQAQHQVTSVLSPYKLSAAQLACPDLP